MPKRQDIKSILIIGAGPIVIGQACEFDYSGAQACKALREEGYRVVLVNSNPATIMTDTEMADATYIEPIEWKVLELIIAKERPDAILPTMGGQTALNCALDLASNGVLDKFGVTMIGATKDAIDKAEDRERFRDAMHKIGLKTPKSYIAHSLEQARHVRQSLGFPVIIRPSFTMGGSGGGIAFNNEEFEQICQSGLDLSPTNELLIEESVLGWKEYEMEVVRDHKDNCIIICSIENFDPMGVHTGDSITVAPAQTLTDKEYQIMRNASLAVLREIGVDTGGSNVQFAINPENGQMIIIEMNPRVSRSSALASKATGFPIAKIAAKLAVGYTLDELMNDITGGATPASFEPSIDYVVTKIPRFAFEKFPQAKPILTTQMKSVGEVMAIGGTFQESLQKALRGLEIDVYGLDEIIDANTPDYKNVIREKLATATPERIFYVADAIRNGVSIDEIFLLSKIDPWFLSQIEDLILQENKLKLKELEKLDFQTLFKLKQSGFSDRRLATLLKTDEISVRQKRHNLGIHPVYKRVDTCAAEFPTVTAYMYSSYDEECEARVSEKQKVVILGGGPNRIGQGIEFDYCCVHAALALREDGFETIMVNCNPETVSTDYDTSDRLYFEPLTLEDTLEIINIENPLGVIVHFGGQTPLKLANDLEKMGAPIIGTSPDAIDLSEDRERFKQALTNIGLKQPPNKTATSVEQALSYANDIGYPLVVRPSYVLGGRAMEIVYDDDGLHKYFDQAVKVSNDSPVLLDKFLNDATEVDVDAICDGKDVLIGGIMQHIEQAGVHSGDSACSLPPFNLSTEIQDQLRLQTKAMALELKVKGLMNVQFAIQGEDIFVLEVNPRASRTVPFVSKAIGRPLAKIATRCMQGVSLSEQNMLNEISPKHFSVKESVFPFTKFIGVDSLLSPEMKSTGEVMGIDYSFGKAFAKSQQASGNSIPSGGVAFISVKDSDKQHLEKVALGLLENGFKIIATTGCHKLLQLAGISSQQVNKVYEGRPNIIDKLKNNEVSLVINTTKGSKAFSDSFEIRREALFNKITYYTTMAGALALIEALSDNNKTAVYNLQHLTKD